MFADSVAFFFSSIQEPAVVHLCNCKWMPWNNTPHHTTIGVILAPHYSDHKSYSSWSVLLHVLYFVWPWTALAVFSQYWYAQLIMVLLRHFFLGHFCLYLIEQWRFFRREGWKSTWGHQGVRGWNWTEAPASVQGLVAYGHTLRCP